MEELRFVDKYKKIDYYFEYTYDIIVYYIEILIKFIKFVMNVSWFYIMWIILHFIASQLYIKLCVPYSLYGLIISPFISSTPHCQGLRWLIQTGANVINNMWLVIGTWFCANLFIFGNNNNLNNNTE
jgi:hypothetical protein